VHFGTDTYKNSIKIVHMIIVDKLRSITDLTKILAIDLHTA
jgi:hypothetical protein